MDDPSLDTVPRFFHPFLLCPVCGAVRFYILFSEASFFTLLCDGCGTEFEVSISNSYDAYLRPLLSDPDQKCLDL